MQLEIGRVLVRHFWQDEAKKAGWGLFLLLMTIMIGTLVFWVTEQNECFRTRLGAERGEAVLATMVEDSDEWLQLRRELDVCTPLGCHGDPQKGECEPGYVEGLGWVGSLYMTVVTASTVGYGDFTPQSWMGKQFCLFYFPIAVALMSKTIMTISLIPTEYRKLMLEAYVLDQYGDQLNVSDLEDLRGSVGIAPSEGLHKNDFTLAMLLRLGRIAKSDFLRTEQVRFCWIGFLCFHLHFHLHFPHFGLILGWNTGRSSSTSTRSRGMDIWTRMICRTSSRHSDEGWR